MAHIADKNWSACIQQIEYVDDAGVTKTRRVITAAGSAHPVGAPAYAKPLAPAVAYDAARDAATFDAIEASLGTE